MSGDKDYFRTFGTPIPRGRAFTDADREDAALVAIVSEMVAEAHVAGRESDRQAHSLSVPTTAPRGAP